MKKLYSYTSLFLLTLFYGPLSSQDTNLVLSSNNLILSRCDGDTATLTAEVFGAYYGTGADGDVSFSSGTNYSDGIRSTVTGSNSSGSSTLELDSIAGLSVNDEILIITMQDDNTSNNSVGTFEFKIISSISSNTLTFTESLLNDYNASSTVKHQVIKVHNYNNVTISSGATLTAHPWDGSTGGIVCFRATGQVNNSGSITVSEIGYRGVGHASSISGNQHYRNMNGAQGEGIYGVGFQGGSSNGSNSTVWNGANGNGGGGGTGRQDAAGGGGGGYANTGNNGGSQSGHTGGSGGSVVGIADLSKLIFGGAGGEGGADEDGHLPGKGGNGGGIIFISAASVVNSGTISSDGEDGGNGTNSNPNGSNGSGCGMGGGGGGAGGSIFISSTVTNSGSITADKGNRGTNNGCGQWGGWGSDGRIAIASPGSSFPTTSPAANQATLPVISGYSYAWSNGSTSNSIQVSPDSTTTYSVVASSGNSTITNNLTITVLQNIPTVDAGSDITICDGGSVTLSASGNATTYSWDNNVSDGVSFSPTATATYTVTGTDANGCSNTDAVDVTVNALPTVDAGADVTICDGGSVTLSGSGAVTYSWDNNVTDGVLFYPTATGTYTVTGTDANGCSNTDAVDVTVNALPTVDAGADVTICDGGSVTLSGSGAVTYSWDNNVTDGVLFYPTATGTYTVTGTDANGCSNTDAVDVTVNALPTVDAGADVTICDGGSVTLSGSGAVTYSWDNNVTDGVSFSPTATGTYTVTGTDANGCSNTDAVDVTVNALPTVDAGADVTICDGGSVTLSGSGAVTYSWDNNVTDGVSFSPTATGTYTVTGTDANGCVNTDAVDVTVNALPTVDAGADVTICDGGSVTLSGSGAVTYSWDNNVSDGVSFSPTATGTYTVTGTDANGCSNTDAVDVTVNPIYYNLLNITTCSGDSVYAGGNYQTTSGIYVDSLQSTDGCDSIVETTLTISSQIIANVSVSVCYGDSALINGSYQAASGIFYDTTLTASGCDSVTVTSFTVDNLISSNASAEICSGDSLLIGGAYQSTAGNYVDTLSTVSGCDSLVTTTLTVNTASSSTDTHQAACDFTWIDGVTYTASNSTATFITSNALGCDSVVTLDLTINPIIATIAQNGNDIEASASNGTAPYYYEWNTGETTAAITPNVNGPYWVVVSDADTCYSDTATFDVTFVSGTGIKTINNILSIYPNPTNDLINIDVKGDNQYILTNVYDIFGKKLLTTKNNIISLQNFEDGVYIFEIETKFNSFTNRVIKK